MDAAISESVQKCIDDFDARIESLEAELAECRSARDYLAKMFPNGRGVEKSNRQNKKSIPRRTLPKGAPREPTPSLVAVRKRKESPKISYEEARERIVEYLKANPGPQIRNQVMKKLGLKPGSMTPIFKDKRFKINKAGQVELAGGHSEKQSRKHGKSQLQDSDEVLTHNEQSGYSDQILKRAREAIYTELSIADSSMTPREIAKALNYEPDFVKAALDHEWFKQEGNGWTIG